MYAGLARIMRASMVRTAETPETKGHRMAHDREYREQTEEDLENTPPMSGMQKAILAIAAVVLAAVTAYIAFL